ncbi:hypothetical protein ABZP36_030190 [Zizania latifolia]
MSRQHHQQHHEPPPPACCCGCGSDYPAPASLYYPVPATPTSGSDHLLHAIAAHLLLGSTPPPPSQPQPQPQAPQAPAAAHHAYPYPYQYQYQQPKPHPYPQQQPQPLANPFDHGHLLLHSLLRRVAALESTIPHCFPSAPVPPPRPNHRRHRVAAHQDVEEEEKEDAPPSPPRRTRAASSARERAARTIQAHFRRFLARRSRTLRQLKELAVLRSKAAALRGSLSGRRGAGDPAAISEATMDLLFHLDAIQGGDPMIREGKRTVSRELTRILEFVDKVLVKEHEEIATSGALDTNDYHEGCNGAFAANAPAMNKKKVSFCNKGKVRELHDETEHGSDAEESSETSSSAEADERKRTYSKRSANGKPGLAAPMPVYMESRRIDGERV